MEKVIALKYVADIPGVCVAIDTAIERDIIVRPDSGKFYTFKKCDKGVYYFIRKNRNIKRRKYHEISHNIVITISNWLITNPLSLPSNRTKINTKSENEVADKARKLQQIIRWPRNTSFKSCSGNNLIVNNVITANDINI